MPYGVLVAEAKLAAAAATIAVVMFGCSCPNAIEEEYVFSCRPPMALPDSASSI
jgi:hypothetical protein